MFGTRMNDAQVATLVDKMRERGMCKSKVPARAMYEATDRRLICHKVKSSKALTLLYGPWVVEDNGDSFKTALEKDIPVIALVHDVATPSTARGKSVTVSVRSNDGLLDVTYTLSRGKKPIRVGVYPYDTEAVMRAITQQPIEVLLKYMGTHPMLDAYIKHRLSTPKAE
jgi:hypothetical protein